MPKLLLVNVVDREIPGFSTCRISKIPPLGIAYVAAATPDRWEVCLQDENFETFQLPSGTDLVGLSAMTPDAYRAYRIARRCRDLAIPTVMGGIHASMNPKEALAHTDAVVVGEAETVWSRVLGDFENGNLHRIYRGTWDELGELPTPRRDLFSSSYRTATVQTARGCPFGCEFCSVSRFNGGRYRTRPIESVIEELASIPQKAVFFVDDNLFGTGERGRERALKLFRLMVEKGIRKYWWGQTSLEMSKDSELLAWAARSGCKLLLIGFESTEQGALHQMGKKVNLRLEPSHYNEAIRAFHKKGIAVWGGFILGNDGETSRSLKNTRSFLKKSRLDVLQLTASTPLPGTRLYERLAREDRITRTQYPEDWRRYSFMECVIRPRELTEGELDRELFRLRRRYWGSTPLRMLRFLRTLWNTRSLTSALAANKMNRSWQAIYREIYHPPGRLRLSRPNEVAEPFQPLVESSLPIR